MDELVEGLVGLNVGEEAVVGGLTDLGLEIPQIAHHVLQQLGPDVVLNFTRVEIDDFEGEGAGEQVDIFL